MEHILLAQNQPKVLACVVNSTYAQSVADYAAWAAVQLKAPLELLHVLADHHPESQPQDHSGVIGVDSSERLLEDLSSHEGAINKVAREQGRALLATLRTRCLNAGAQTDVRLRYGALNETLQERSTDSLLYVMGRRGASAQTKPRTLGSQLERVVRSLNKPVLTVTQSFRRPQRAVMAFDNSAITRRGIEFLAQNPLLQGIQLHILMVGADTPAQHKAQDWAQKMLTGKAAGLQTSIQAGEPQAVLERYIKEHGIDLLIMGAYTHSLLRSLLQRSTTNKLLQNLDIATLLLR